MLQIAHRIFHISLNLRRHKGVITKVQTQKTCGSCYALSVIETVESIVAIRTGKLTPLSVSQMLDCNEYHMNCEGGNPCGLLNWLQKTQTCLLSADEYSKLNAVNNTQKCFLSQQNTPGPKIEDYSCNEFVLSPRVTQNKPF